MEEYIESEKLENLLNQMKQVPVLSGSNLNNLTLKSGYQRGFSGFQGGDNLHQNDIPQGTDFDKSKFLFFKFLTVNF